MKAGEVEWHTHRLFGLVVRAPTPLPAPHSSSPPDVTFHPAEHRLFSELHAEHPPFAVSIEKDRILVDWSQRVQFVIESRGGGYDVAFHSDTIKTDDILNTLLPHILSFILLERGQEQLHAATLVRDGYAIALLGESGQGKSTLAAAMIQAGWKLLTDDVAAFRGHEVLPAIQRIKLTPKAAAATIGIRDGFPIDDERGKWSYRLDAAECATEPAAAQRIVVIRPNASGLELGVVRPPDAFRALAASTFNPFGQSEQRLRSHIEFINQLMQNTEIREIKIPRRLELLSGAAGLVTS